MYPGFFWNLQCVAEWFWSLRRKHVAQCGNLFFWRCNRKESCKDLEDCEKVSGCFRPLSQFPPLLASLYLELEKETGQELLWFGEVNTFQVVFWGDGAPFGKEDTSCAWLVSFLNRGKHVLSTNEKFYIWCKLLWDISVVQRYVSYLFKEISVIEKQTFSIHDREIRLKVFWIP